MHGNARDPSGERICFVRASRPGYGPGQFSHELVALSRGWSLVRSGGSLLYVNLYDAGDHR